MLRVTKFSLDMIDRKLDIYDFHAWFTLEYKNVQTIMLSTISCLHWI